MPSLEKSMISTSFEISGYKIIKNFGIVHAAKTRYIASLEKARQEIFESMILQAGNLGANAVIGVRYDLSMGYGMSEVFCYGTAVRVEKE